MRSVLDCPKTINTMDAIYCLPDFTKSIYRLRYNLQIVKHFIFLKFSLLRDKNQRHAFPRRPALGREGELNARAGQRTLRHVQNKRTRSLAHTRARARTKVESIGTYELIHGCAFVGLAHGELTAAARRRLLFIHGQGPPRPDEEGGEGG